MKQIWVVDDDQEMSNAIGLMLKLLDCEVTGFDNAKSAAESLLSGGRPDLIFLDINLDEVSGMDMLEFLRRRAEWRNLPVIMLSSETADTVVDKALGRGANGYVMKPVTLSELEKAMSEVLNK